MDSKLKPKEDRVREGITILQKLKEVGIPPTDIGFRNIQEAVSEWVKTGEPISKKIPFARVDRIAEVVLPQKRTAIASVVLRVIPND
jgi:hypothetical protein